MINRYNELSSELIVSELTYGSNQGQHFLPCSKIVLFWLAQTNVSVYNNTFLAVPFHFEYRRSNAGVIHVCVAYGGRSIRLKWLTFTCPHHV